jgi:hypothetical protein
MLGEKDRDPSDAQAVLAAILAAREVYPDKEFQTWANAWIAGRDRKKHSAGTIATGIRLDWFLPDPDGEKWEQRLIELSARTATAEEFHHSALADLESRVEFESIEFASPVDLEAEANILASQSALAASQAAYAYASEALDQGSPERATKQVREALHTAVMLAKATASSCKRLRRNESDD